MKSALFVVFFVASASAVPTFIRTESLSPDEKIVGGDQTDIELAPWQVSVQYNDRHICGGSIISTDYVVTAAHCTNGFNGNMMTIRFGTPYREIGGKMVGIRSIHQHPNYNSQLLDYDISLLYVTSRFILRGNVATISLPSSTTRWPPGTSALVSGWGKTAENGGSPLYLRSVTVKIVSESSCKDEYGESRITSRMLCAGVDGGGKDACQGDSGGPLVINNVLAGIVSWGYGCGDRRYPGVYSSVPALRGYIKKVTGI
ncbi:trypsin-1-like [Tenebrio molitor]|uniref:trypsin-1-like n=1 Tax=Tenebrio molitor TaxID=7067 RepID=UPI0036249DA7